MERELADDLPAPRARELVADELAMLVDEIPDPLMGMSPEAFAAGVTERNCMAEEVARQLDEMHQIGEHKAEREKRFQRPKPRKWPVRCYPSPRILSPIALEQMQRFCREHPNGEVAATGWISDEGKVSALVLHGEGKADSVVIDCLALEADIRGEGFEVLIHTHRPQTGAYMTTDEWRLDVSENDERICERLSRFGLAFLICDHECFVVRVVHPGRKLICPRQEY
jgi:hypothetical protein